MHSTKWQSRLQQVQARVLRIPCTGRPLAIVVKHLSFAKQRFNSTADPIAKVALMLLPIATLLAFVSSDSRRCTNDQQRAKNLLRKLQSKFCPAMGLSADWGIICEAFLRLVHKTKKPFVLRTLFIDSYVFSIGKLRP